ncbi:MAG: DUF86 domain-containing protein [Syntrophomonas sp.]|nr:DUF86 domain-containing protein [Syntrophomonas sp.]
MCDKDRICNKLGKLYSYYEELKNFSAISLEEYKCNSVYRRAIERTMQLIVECATDINNMLLRMNGSKGASDYFNSFIDIAELNIIPVEFALEIAPSTGLRNILVHEYEEIDDAIVYRSIEMCLKHYLKYVALINKYLES